LFKITELRVAASLCLSDIASMSGAWYSVQKHFACNSPPLANKSVVLTERLVTQHCMLVDVLQPVNMELFLWKTQLQVFST